jgi:hypothetical protein
MRETLDSVPSTAGKEGRKEGKKGGSEGESKVRVGIWTNPKAL